MTVTDHFGRLGFPRRASLGAEELRARYHELARKTSGAEETGAPALNAAYACLSQPSTRLRHLLELYFPGDAGARRDGTIPDAFVDLFSSLARAIQQVDAVCVKKKAALSPLSRALLAGAEMEARESLEAAGSLIQSHRETLERGLLPEIDALLKSDPSSIELREKLAGACRAFGFLDKWRSQVRAKLLELFEAAA